MIPRILVTLVVLGLSDELIQATFGAGMKGVKPENVPLIEELILSTLKKAVAEGRKETMQLATYEMIDVALGFDRDAVKAAMNSMEFSLREFNTGSFPRGLSLMLGTL